MADDLVEHPLQLGSADGLAVFHILRECTECLADVEFALDACDLLAVRILPGLVCGGRKCHAAIYVLYVEVMTYRVYQCTISTDGYCDDK
jgi:hypothetical protein